MKNIDNDVLEEKQLEELGNWMDEPHNVLFNLINGCLAINYNFEKNNVLI